MITVLLLVHTLPIDLLASAAAKTTLMSSHLRGLRIQMLVYAGATLLVLLLLTVLSVYKRAGMTQYGWLKQREERARSQE